MAFFGGDGLPSTIPVCPLSGKGSVSVVHIRHACPGTLDLHLSYCSRVAVICTSGDRLPWERLRLDLFADRVSSLQTGNGGGEARIAYVDGAVERVAKVLAIQDTDIAALITAAYVASGTDAVP